MIAYVIIGLYVEILYEFYNISKTLFHESFGISNRRRDDTLLPRNAVRNDITSLLLSLFIIINHTRLTRREGEGWGVVIERESMRVARSRTNCPSRERYTLIETAIYGASEARFPRTLAT